MWVVFVAVFAASLMVELARSRHAHEVSPREALTHSLVWVGLALAFNVGIYLVMDATSALEFLTGYLIELSLSVDNIFVFIMVFSAFSVPPLYRQRVLTWGILGAVILRTVMVLIGAALIARFNWIMYVFGAFLVYTGIKMAFSHDDEGIDAGENGIVKLARRIFPVTDQFEKELFFIRRNGVLMATPLFLVLVLIEGSDVMFAMDSIPAIFAITKQPFIVLTSNIFAIMGLRSLYFLLDGIMGKFRFLKYGLSVILTFIGVKMILMYWHVHIPIFHSLGVVIGVLALSVILSLIIPERDEAPSIDHQ